MGFFLGVLLGFFLGFFGVFSQSGWGFLGFFLGFFLRVDGFFFGFFLRVLGVFLGFFLRVPWKNRDLSGCSEIPLSIQSSTLFVDLRTDDLIRVRPVIPE